MAIEREKDGRFSPGNAGGPGRPKREIEAEALSILATRITPDLWAAMVITMVKEVIEKRNVSAFKALAEYYAGKPTERVEISESDTYEVTLKLPVFDNGAQDLIHTGEIVSPLDDNLALPEPEIEKRDNGAENDTN